MLHEYVQTLSSYQRIYRRTTDDGDGDGDRDTLSVTHSLAVLCLFLHKIWEMRIQEAVIWHMIGPLCARKGLVFHFTRTQYNGTLYSFTPTHLGLPFKLQHCRRCTWSKYTNPHFYLFFTLVLFVCFFIHSSMYSSSFFIL